MTFEELAARLEEGDTATAIAALLDQAGKLQRDRYLSPGQYDFIEAKLARIQRLQAEAAPQKKASVETPAEEPVVDSEPEPKAAPKKARRSFLAGRGKKGK